MRAQPQDMLFGNNNVIDLMTKSYSTPQPIDNTENVTTNGRTLIPISRVPSAPGSLKLVNENYYWSLSLPRINTFISVTPYLLSFVTALTLAPLAED